MPASPVLTPAGMRAWERATWDAGVREADVIARVGAEVARAARRMAPQGPVLLLAGTGHNGDDVRAALPHWSPGDATLLEVADPARALVTLQAALRTRPALVVDGLFGIGLNRALSPDWRAIIEALNASDARVLAVDVPSGLNASDGSSWDAVVRAEETLTVGAPKLGMLLGDASHHVGRIRVTGDVGLVEWTTAGIPADEIAGEWGRPGDFEGWPPPRRVDGHKGSHGHVLVVAGNVGYHGAAVLAVRGALRANPGLVTAWTHASAYLPVASQVASAMVQAWEPAREAPEGVTCIVVGPGLAGQGVGPWWAERVRAWWAHSPTAMVADASALDWLPKGHVGPGKVRVVTPHPGEAGRLLGCSAAHVQADRVGALQRLATDFEGAWVVLKGHATLVGRSGVKPWWNSTGNPWLAQGGSGDVLAGFLGGLLAQPMLAPDPGTAVRAAALEHGAAADRLRAAGPGWTTEDLAHEVGRGIGRCQPSLP
jgi:NAD(P)H-hydrate epimerase